MDVREALLEAAIKVYGEAGMRGATTRRIAETANVNEVTLFRHFRRKSDLMQAALEHVTSHTVGNRLPEQPVDPGAELVAWCRAHHRELYKRRALIRKAMSEFEQDPSCCARGMHASVRIAQELRDYLRRVKTTGLAGASWDERMALVTLLKWAASPELRQLDVGILLVTESAAELHADLLQNPHVAQIRLDLPDAEERHRRALSRGEQIIHVEQHDLAARREEAWAARARGSQADKAVRAAVEGPISSFWPGSALQLHPDVVFCVDPDSASRLTLLDYYQRVAENEERLQPRL